MNTKNRIETILKENNVNIKGTSFSTTKANNFNLYFHSQYGVEARTLAYLGENMFDFKVHAISQTNELEHPIFELTGENKKVDESIESKLNLFSENLTKYISNPKEIVSPHSTVSINHLPIEISTLGKRIANRGFGIIGNNHGENTVFYATQGNILMIPKLYEDLNRSQNVWNINVLPMNPFTSNLRLKIYSSEKLSGAELDKTAEDISKYHIHRRNAKRAVSHRVQHMKNSK